MIFLLLILSSIYTYTAIPSIRSPLFKRYIAISTNLFNHARDGAVSFTKTYSKNDDFEDEFDDLLREKLNRLSPRDNETPQPSTPPVLLTGLNKLQVLNRALFSGVFVAGIGLGITLESSINTNPKDLASRDAIDRNAPNPKLCATYGSSAMVLDQRVFVTFNPFNVYVTQADTKPGCVLRQSNVINLLQVERKLVSDEDMENCKNSFNTWGFIGDINNNPQLNCVYQSDDAQNEFLSNPKVGLGEDVYDKNGIRISK
eukprot:gene27723-36540_t